ncbi:major facilitator superfamily transporter [Ephemerocybe angulata]|uniref:Major facilitator superfamily transporter n=1 Tax=Ephemerocybe angulata TaxID=980116 RepID=A0A8H6HBC5_9AGAR|nr:major facilitator superfamily transporter [Tulosesus angulatus]
MSTTTENIVQVETSDEETPLLKQQRPKGRTPLPKLQIGIVLLLQVCEPLCSQSIYPYINELVSTLDIVQGDEKKVGYYAGLIESLFFATEAMTVLQWSRMSDRIGRKPVLLLGLVGTILSILCFGLSRSFWTLVVSRCLCGLLNGNIGVMKSAMGELTDPTNRAEAFALLPVVWAAGASFGPLLGGSLSRPADRFPQSVFAGQFWKDYPYFLPCLATATYTALTFVVTAIWLKESIPQKIKHSRKRVTSDASDITVTDRSPAEADEDDNAPLPLRSVLTFPVVISILNYVTLAFLNISVNALLPLFFHMPVAMGGLDLDPVVIGYIMSLYGAGSGLFQIVLFSPLVRGYGVRKTFLLSVSTFVPVFMTFPLMSLVAKYCGVGWIVWSLLGMVLGLLFLMDTAYGCIFMFVTASAPNKRSLGATNGLSQTTVSAARAIGPALSTSLYSFSIEYNVLGGYGVYAVLATLSLGALLLAVQLPHKLWGEEDADEVGDSEGDGGALKN